jgi:alpha-N-arabinofuranosidase
MAEKPRSLARLAGSASRNGNVVTLSAVNLSHNEPLETAVDIHGAKVRSAKATVLAGASMQAHNTFTAPDALKPSEMQVTVSGDGLRITMPAASVVKLRVEVG